jgi:hypothetical protein
MNELHNLGLFIFLIKKTQTNYMWFLEEFKISEIYVLLFLILYLLSILNQIIYTIPCICYSFETCSKSMNYMPNATPSIIIQNLDLLFELTTCLTPI